jgi:hypothetical protein
VKIRAMISGIFTAHANCPNKFFRLQSMMG